MSPFPRDENNCGPWTQLEKYKEYWAKAHPMWLDTSLGLICVEIQIILNQKFNLCGWIQVQMKLHHMAWEKTASTHSTSKAMVQNRNQEHTGQACLINLWSTVDKTSSDSKNFKPINVWRDNKYSISTFKRENLTQHN